MKSEAMEHIMGHTGLLYRLWLIKGQTILSKGVYDFTVRRIILVILVWKNDKMSRKNYLCLKSSTESEFIKMGKG